MKMNLARMKSLRKRLNQLRNNNNQTVLQREKKTVMRKAKMIKRHKRRNLNLRNHLKNQTVRMRKTRMKTNQRMR